MADLHVQLLWSSIHGWRKKEKLQSVALALVLPEQVSILPSEDKILKTQSLLQPSFGDVALATNASDLTWTHSFWRLRRDCGHGALESVHTGSQELTVNFSRTL